MTTKIWPTMAQAVAHARHTAVAPLTWNPTEHLLARGSFGATPYTSGLVARYGPDAWFKQQITYGTTYKGYKGYPVAAKAVGNLLGMNPYDLRQWLIGQGDEYGWDAMDQLTQMTIALQGWSPAQLYEVLVDVFSNHLNVQNRRGDLWVTRHAYDRDVIRKYAMGSFTNMLMASAKHPAMLQYLNLAESTKTSINENYGREILELHTVGLHYTQSDVTNCAKILTGRTIDDNQHYVYDDYIHYTGAIQVLGVWQSNTSAEGGEAAGDQLLRYLASHRYTALNIARKLCVRFVSDTPSSSLVSAIADVYLANDTKIVPTVSAIFRTTEFWESRGKKTRRPRENLLATRRRLSVPCTKWSKGGSTLQWLTEDIGDPPLEWPAPNGYPDVAAAWRSSGDLVNLWQLHVGLLGGWWNGDGLPAVTIKNLYGARTPTTSGQAIDYMTQYLTGMTWSAAHKAVLQKFLNEPASTPMASSILRWWDSALAVTILHGPHHALK